MGRSHSDQGCRPKVRAGALIVGGALFASAVFSVATAQSFQARPPAPASQPAGPVPSVTAPVDQPAQPGWSSPTPAPGFIDSFTRWMQESTAGFNARLGGNSQDMSEAANSAAKSTADVARGAADAVTGIARDTAGALSKLPTSRVAAGRERCPVAPNGAPDCVVAAATLCRANGYVGGSSIDFETAEVCPADAALARWRGERVVCTTENYVTRALCQ
jgi:hypothetical protein